MKEIEEWIIKNNPYELVRGIGGQWDVLNAKHRGWEEGAKEMAEHLQSQPPTKDQIAKVIAILDNIGNGCQNLVYDCNITAEIVLKHWDNE